MNERKFPVCGRRGRQIFNYSMLFSFSLDASKMVITWNVKAWLEVDPDAPAAVYFKDENEAVFYHRVRRKLRLLASPFVNDLGDCLGVSS